MGFSVFLESASKEVLDTVIDQHSVLHGLLPKPEDDDYPMLGSVDRYGDTIFNRPQMRLFLREWQTVVQKAKTASEIDITDKIKRMGERCMNEVHCYIRFAGD